MSLNNPRKTVLIAGASGAVGSAAMAHFARLSDWDVIGISRHPPIRPVGHAKHVALDLLDRDRCAAAVAMLGNVTHVVFAALNEREDDVIAGWSDPAQMTKNAQMLENLCDPLFEAAPNLRHISLVHGPKAYGVHLPGLNLPVPLTETLPRAPGDNFYYWQEDYLLQKKREGAGQSDWGITLLRPSGIIGATVGGHLSPFLVLTVFASLCREAGLPMPLPAGRGDVLDFTDSDLVAEALAWAADAPEAWDQAFNLCNGDVFSIRDAFPLVAETLGVAVGETRVYDIADELSALAHLWPGMVKKYGLAVPDLDTLLGCSPQVARVWTAPVPPGEELRWNLCSTIKIRKAGFTGCVDTADMFRSYCYRYQELGMIPRLR